MKSAVADYRYRVECLRIVPVAGATIRLTDFPRDLTMAGGQVYSSTSGYEFTGHSSTAGFAPDSIDLGGIIAAAGVSRSAVASGLLDGARCYGFATTWRTPIEDEEPLSAGIFGKTSLLDDRFRIAGVSLVDVLGQGVGKTYGAACPKRFLGQEPGGCLVPVAANTVTGTLTAVTSASVFRDSARGEAVDTFGAGKIAFTTGPNAGLKGLEIKSHTSGGWLEVQEAFYYLPTVGDAYAMTRGCRKRPEDCKSRWNGSALFNNIVNFGGFPNVPTTSQYAKFGQGG
jgi:uncharacterized phage protein (TIGR02218 family)